MAKCPLYDCNIDWKWDWCQDTYRAEPDIWCKETVIVDMEESPADDKWVEKYNHGLIPLKMKGIGITMLQCECGCVLAINVNDKNYGSAPFNHPEWSEVDWEKESWPEMGREVI